MLKLLQSIRTIILILLVVITASCNQNRDKILIGYLQITPDPILDVAKASLFKVLKDSGFVDGQNIKILDNNAQGDLSMIPTILQSLISQRVDVIVTNSTPCMLAAAQIVKDIPVVFTVSFGPEQVGMKQAPPNLYGVYDTLKVKETVDLIQKCIPTIKRIGLPTNNSEPNASYSAKVFSDEFTRRGIEVVSSQVNSPNDIIMAAQSLSQKNIDAFIVAADNTVYLGLNALANVADKEKIPLIVTDPMHINKGAALGYGVNYEDWGHMSGLKVIDVLKNRQGKDQKIVPIFNYSLTVNKKACELQGLNVPQDVMSMANLVIE